ncbi:MAG: DinB family protein [Saprospiraceae bacterium]
MKRSQIFPMPEYFDRYINLVDDVELLEALQTSIDEIDSFPLQQWKEIGDKVYEPGKWTIKDIIQHIIDTERIFTYRSLVFARGEKSILPSFSEDDYALQANASKRSLESLINELRLTHQSTKSMFESFTEAMLNSIGIGFRGEYSVASIAFIIPGHQRWHLKVIEDKYLSLIN